MDLIEELVSEYGENNRVVITSALRWLAEEEPEWDLEVPMNKREFIREIVGKWGKSDGQR